MFDLEDIDKLTDFSDLKNFPKEELQNYSSQLHEAIEQYKEMEKNKNYEINNSNEVGGNFLGVIMSKINKIFDLLNWFGLAAIISIVLYLGYILIKKFCKKENNIDKGNKNKKKKKKEI